MKQDLPLKDIVDAHDIHWWPLAWGWWLCLVMVIAAFAALAYWLYQRKRKQQGLLLLQQTLAQPQTSITAVNLAVKQAALCYYPRQQIASLEGASWHAFLVAQVSAAQRDAFAEQLAPYTPLQYQQPPAEAITAYQQLLLDWAAKAWPPRKHEVEDV